jgi:hypothetical protein
MRNAGKELIRMLELGRLTIKCATIDVFEKWEHEGGAEFSAKLKVGHSADEWSEFINNLNGIDYNSGYGSQKLFGIVWFTDGSWAERGEYDGSEWWEHRTLPAIPSELM